jgi:hypothetical protein
MRLRVLPVASDYGVLLTHTRTNEAELAAAVRQLSGGILM